jgi:hypothetical protein
MFTNDKLQAGESLNNAMQELPTSSTKQDPITMNTLLERE